MQQRSPAGLKSQTLSVSSPLSYGEHHCTRETPEVSEHNYKENDKLGGSNAHVHILYKL